MSKVKGGGNTKNVKDSPGRRLGVKKFGGETVRRGETILRQVGRTKIAGPGTFMSRDFTIHASHDGCVSFRNIRTRDFAGNTMPKTEVSVVTAAE